MKSAHIICDRYLSPDGEKMTLGGMQTYFTALSKVLRGQGYRVYIHHKAIIDFVKEVNNITVCGYSYNSESSRLAKDIFKEVKRIASKSTDLIVFGSEMWIVDSDGYKCVAIQHGIPWDIPCHQNFGILKYWLFYIYKAYKAFCNIRNVNMVKNLVCVDYNYINWYRALVAYPKAKLYCVPNFSEIPADSYYSRDNIIRIIFARRLWEYRGTKVFYYAINRILKEYNNVFITIAGDGPDESWLKERLVDDPRVEFIHYSCQDSIAIHKNKQIAVVPTVGSEGTSLSLLEAMASKCAVICTDVGGLTNVVLDGYNGLVIPAGSSEALYIAIKKLILDQNYCKCLAEKGFETVSAAFSLEKWQQSWENIIQVVTKP